MRISEIFESIQGEGRFMGHPSIFVRMFGCNLRCDSCDTKYAYEEGEYIEYSVRELYDEILSLKKPEYKVIWTGGEPLLQRKDIIELSSQIPDCHIETNGTINLDESYLFERITVSPKKNILSDYENFFSYWNKDNVDFKFVIGKHDWCFKERDIKKIINKNFISKDKIWLMPHGVDKEGVCLSSKKVWKLCIDLGVNYSDRLHIRVWNDRRKI